MGFVVNEKNVLGEKSGVMGPEFEADRVAAEQQAAADHINRADDHRRAGRIGRPLTVIRKLTAQGADSKRGSFRRWQRQRTKPAKFV